ncbi:hypothetical protein TcasGA2_TC014958 [Tribolium castaneum]|uniref:Uncharacterized protein n=1 Tax=Tribolium castaneum TaxID=7070 RepID=D2A3R8_TRICA|nr:hypothetical protein TcasGA2_TC014958 [Tribolium castaneum]
MRELRHLLFRNLPNIIKKNFHPEMSETPAAKTQPGGNTPCFLNSDKLQFLPKISTALEVLHLLEENLQVPKTQKPNSLELNKSPKYYNEFEFLARTSNFSGWKFFFMVARNSSDFFNVTLTEAYLITGCLFFGRVIEF